MVDTRPQPQARAPLHRRGNWKPPRGRERGDAGRCHAGSAAPGPRVGDTRPGLIALLPSSRLPPLLRSLAHRHCPASQKTPAAHHQTLVSEAISPATERNEDSPGGPRPGGGRSRGPCCCGGGGGEAQDGDGAQGGGGGGAEGGPRGEEGGGGGGPAPALGVRAEGLRDPLPAVHPHRGRRRHGLPSPPHPALLRPRTSRRRLAHIHRHPCVPAHRHVPHAQVQGEAPQEPCPARPVHALLQPQHRRVRVHHSRHCGSAGYHPHSCCCSGADRLHLLGCQEGLRLQLHLPIPVHQPPGTSGVPHHPALLPAGKGGHDHLRVPGHPGVLGLHRLRHPHAAQAPHLQRVRGRRHLPLPGRHQPLHGPDVALLPVIDCQPRLTPC